MGILDPVGDLLSDITDPVEDLVGGLGDGITGVVDGIGDGLGNITSGIGHGIESIANLGVKILSIPLKFAESFLKIAQQMFGGLGSLMQMLPILLIGGVVIFVFVEGKSLLSGDKDE